MHFYCLFVNIYFLGEKKIILDFPITNEILFRNIENIVQKKIKNQIKLEKAWTKTKQREKMAILITPFSYSPQASSLYLSSKLHNTNIIYNTYGCRSSTPLRSFVLCSSQQLSQQISSPTPHPILIDKSFLCISEAKSENELWAASSLRVRIFYDFQHDTLNTEVSCSWSIFFFFFFPIAKFSYLLLA